MICPECTNSIRPVARFMMQSGYYVARTHPGVIEDLLAALRSDLDRTAADDGS